MSKVSYLVTCCNEGHEIVHLFNSILNVLGQTDELVILEDPKNDEMTKLAIWNALEKLPPNGSARHIQHPLNRDYGAHKNFGIEQCKGDWIFQIDGDERLPEYLLGENLHALIDSNPTIEAYAIPRINAWIGLTAEHAKQWGWSLDMSPTYKRLRAAWPDYQMRLFKNSHHIRFQKRLHEIIEGFKSYALLPADEEWALYHNKTIETQIKTNLRYNEWFTAEENRGHNGVATI